MTYQELERFNLIGKQIVDKLPLGEIVFWWTTVGIILVGICLLVNHNIITGSNINNDPKENILLVFITIFSWPIVLFLIPIIWLNGLFKRMI